MKNSNLLNWLWTDSHEKQSPQRFARYAAMLIMLLILGVGQMWADSGEFYNMYVGYSFGGVAGSAEGSDKGTGLTQDLGTLTSSTFTITGVYLKCKDDWGYNYKSQGGQLCYQNKGGSTQYISCSTRKDKNNGDTYEWQNSSPNVELANYENASGSYRFECWGQTWDWDGGGSSGDWYFPYSSGHYVLNYKIAPPTVTGYTISINNRVVGDEGDGTENNPYIITWGVNPTISVSSPSVHHTDANSSMQYKYGIGSWGTSTSTTVSPSTSKQSITISARRRNNSDETLVSASTLEQTIWYQWEDPYTINVQTNGVGTGAVSPSTVYAKGNVASAAFTASVPVADAAKYEFVDWSATTGVTLQSANTAATNTVKATATGTVTANFRAKNYNITYDPAVASNCTYTTTPASAAYGSTVNLTITPDANYTISSVTAVDASSNTVTVSGSEPNYSFTMPASNVTVTIETALSSMTVTLDADETNHGNIASATTSQEYAYGAATTTIPNLPPGADGYKFMGYYTSPAGGGTKLINADGSWIASVDGYTDGSKNWIHGSDVTLYAYYQAATITSLALPGGSVYTVGGSAFTARATVSAFDGNALVCWQVKKGSEEVSTTFTPVSGNEVTVSIPATPGSYKVVASLKAGTTCSGDVLHTAQQSFTVQGNYTVSITNGSGSSSVGEVTTATATANAAATGMKFDRWNVTGTISYTSGDANSREITFNASSNITLTAVYVARTTKKVYFAKPSSWENVYAYAWEDGNATNKNGDWDATAITSNTETIKGTTYHYYEYYIDDNGETGGDKTNQNAWDRIIFHQGTSPGTAQSTKTADLTLVGGHFYHIADGSGENGRDAATLSGSASAEDWYVCGYWNASTNDWGFAHPINLNGTTSGSVVVTVTASLTQEFKIYRASTDQWFKWTGGPSEDYYDNYAALIGDPMTLRIYNANRNTFTSYATEYLFTLDITSTSNPVLTLVPNDNTPYSATLSKSGHGSLSVGTGAITLKQYIPTTITATPEPGYRFTGWTTTGSVAYAGGTSSSDATASFTATDNGGTITANFTNEGIIYLDKSAIASKWGGTPYVYFYSAAYWNNEAGSGSKKTSSEGVPGTCISGPHAMTRIGSSQIWYYDYSSLLSAGSSKQYIAFVDNSNQGNDHNWFDACSVIYRGDFYPNSSLFVVKDYTEYKNKHDKVQTAYYNKGYWRKFNDTDPGYVIKTYNAYGSAICTGTYRLSSTEPGARNCTVDVPLSAGDSYFKVVGCDTTTINSVVYAGTYYRDADNGTMSTDNCTSWLLTDESGSNTGVRATAATDYTFTLTLGEGSLYISVDFPMAVGDFRLMYDGKMRTTYVSKKKHESNFIRKLKAPVVASDTTKKDTVSFFVDPVKGDLAPSIGFQWCSSIVGYTVTWRDTLGSSKPDLSSIKKAGVYDFIVTQTRSKAGVHTISCALEGAYTGNYYIRTDKAAGGWKSYKVAKDNQVVYSEVSRKYNFDYYYCNWFNAGDNVKFTIANDYSDCITDTVENDTYVTQTGGNVGKLSYSANVRFMFNDSTNVITRAYINGSKESNRYLVLTGDEKTFNADGSEITASGVLEDNELEFDDKGNWVYQKDLKAQTESKVSVTAAYNGNIQTLIDDQTLITTTGADEHKYKLRAVYDFKTNQLIAAWLPDAEDIEENMSVTADMMLIRRSQNAADQIHFNGGSISDIKTMVGAIEFYKDSIVGRVGNFNGDAIGASGNRAFRELMLYISFPFDVAVNDIYGFGQLNREWYLQYYDGAERASKGFFRGDGTTTFWKYMTLADTLRANVGYSLLLDNDYFNTDGAGVWKNIADGESVYLYFPSVKELDGDSIISSTTKTLKVPSHECTIDRPFETASGRSVNHKFTDSHWNMMGMPLFENQTGVATSKFVTTKSDSVSAFVTDKGYFYEWDSLANTLRVRSTSGYTFKSMHGYMVQFSGAIDFSGAAIHTKPASIVARRAQKNEENYTLELQLQQNNQRVSRAYIELRDEACDTFALNEDVYMIYTSLPADLFTYAGNYDVSANVLSVDNHTIPVGVEVHKAGSFTFTMPSNFSGAVTLIDTQTGARTNLALSDYTVTLPKGVCDGRFFIEIDINKMPTAIDGVEDGSGSLKDGKAHKFIQNGLMYILKNGELFDARGNRVK